MTATAFTFSLKSSRALSIIEKREEMGKGEGEGGRGRETGEGERERREGETGGREEERQGRRGGREREKERERGREGGRGRGRERKGGEERCLYCEGGGSHVQYTSHRHRSLNGGPHHTHTHTHTHTAAAPSSPPLTFELRVLIEEVFPEVLDKVHILDSTTFAPHVLNQHLLGYISHGDKKARPG